MQGVFFPHHRSYCTLYGCYTGTQKEKDALETNSESQSNSKNSTIHIALEGERGGADIRMDVCLIPGDIGPIMGLPMVGTEPCLYIFNHFF